MYRSVAAKMLLTRCRARAAAYARVALIQGEIIGAGRAAATAPATNYRERLDMSRVLALSARRIGDESERCLRKARSR